MVIQWSLNGHSVVSLTKNTFDKEFEPLGYVYTNSIAQSTWIKIVERSISNGIID